MPLTPNTRLGAYEILAAIGAGGMGEVYRARDTKLGREVAIKVLPEEFTQHPQKLARFEREARLLAALNHPGIATLHGFEKAKGMPFLVMELVEGETLAERIARGPLPVTEALTLSQQIAEALEAAHEKGVIHRDLKPANIKVDPEGHVKVLDFGLAKAFADEVPDSELSASPTLSRDATRAGVILGTAAYMSPEQAKGKAVDKRADIFSFGAVLCEMLTGKRAFAGEDVSDVLAAVIRAEPDWKAVPRDLDSRIQNLLRRCLRKDRKNRRQSIGDVRVEIQEILTQPTVASEAAQPRNQMLPWALMGIVSIAFLVALWRPWRSEIPSESSVRLSVNFGAGDSQLYRDRAGRRRFLRTGRRLAFVGLTPDGNRQIYIRPLDNLEATPLSGTEGAIYPFFSPDGQWLAFFTSDGLKKVSVSGGAALTIAEMPFGRGGTWGPDGTIVYSPTLTTGLYRVPASGGTPVELTTQREGETSHLRPWFLPNGKAVLFAVQTQGGSFDDATIEAVLLETGERKVLHRGGLYPRYASSGHLLYAHQATVFAMPFDADRIEPTGEPSPVIEGVQRPGLGVAHFAVADDGTLVYVPGGAAQANRRLVWVDREGHEEPLPLESAAYHVVNLSPDGTRLALDFSERDSSDVWLYDFSIGTLSRFTFDAAQDTDPVWSPDGARIFFSSDRDGPRNVHSKPSDGSGNVARLTESQSTQWPQAVTPDGGVLLLDELGEGIDILHLDLSEPSEPRPFLRTASVERLPQVSPDGRFVAYESAALGTAEIFVRTFPEGGGPFQISSQGGRSPVWSPDGRELFYLDNGALMAVAVETEPGFRVVGRQKLFEGPYADNTQSYDVSRNGDRFLMIKAGGSEDAATQPSMVVVQNWFEELKRLVPTN